MALTQPTIAATTVRDIFQSMSYGPAPEGDAPVREWLKTHSSAFGHFINSAWTDRAMGASFDVHNPSSGALLARVAQGSSADVDAAVSAARAALPALPEGDFYWRDLQGLQVWCQNGDDRLLLGTVAYLIETGANDVLVVKACEGSIDTRERLIPYLPGDSVIRVDLEEALIEVDWFVDDE